MTSTQPTVAVAPERSGGDRHEGAPPVHRAAVGWAAVVVAAVAKSLLLVATGLAVCSLLPAALGFAPTTVMSDSMAPAIRTGDVVVTRPLGAEAPAISQVLLVADPDHPGRMRLHRLVDHRDGMLVLKGDANETEDSSLVRPEDVRGAGFLRVPYVGLPNVWVRTGDLAPLAAMLLALVALGGLANLDRLVDDEGRTRRGRMQGAGRAAAPASATLAVVLAAGLAVTSGAVQPPASAKFTEARANGSNSISMGVFDCVDRSALPQAYLYYSFLTAQGTSATVVEADRSGSNRPGRTFNSPPRVAGSCSGPSSYVTPSTTGHSITQTTAVTAPSTYSVSIWFKSDVNRGKIAGFGNTANGASTTYDRHVWLNASGALTFGAKNSLNVATQCSGTTDVGDSGWHLVVATFNGATGAMTLYADDAVVQCTAMLVGTPLTYTGFWQFGYDTLNAAHGWTNTTTATYVGALDEAAVYSTVLTPAQVRAIYAAGH